jgi:hypothetical protein
MLLSCVLSFSSWRAERAHSQISSRIEIGARLGVIAATNQLRDKRLPFFARRRVPIASAS